MRREDDVLHKLVVLSALAVLAIVLVVGGGRAYRRWVRRPAPLPVQRPPVAPDDGVDRPPSVIPPLALSGAQPAASPRPRDFSPAARPKPPITPDRE
ncbi:MAG: hypothetical protein HYZ75_14205 [Elusimicrobia bacterium]|nr:hypothetical protein [Elusimicrobiota bacterium]